MVGQERFREINKLLNKKLDQKKVLIAVHRGSWGGSIIENTILAYMAALQQGADMFECDLIKSTDGVLYTFHSGYENRLLRQTEKLKTMSSEMIDSLTYYNCIGDATRQHVQRFEAVLKHFLGGELFNIDRAWSILPEVDALMRKYPHAIHQAVIKTPAQEEYLEFFQNCPMKYMYMPICSTVEEVKKALSYSDINMVGVEAIAKSAEAELFDPVNIQWMKDQGLYVWTNAITLSDHEKHILCAGFDDNRAIMEGPDGAWGVLMDRGYNVLQTDWPTQMSQYREQKYC